MVREVFKSIPTPLTTEGVWLISIAEVPIEHPS
jgi:hypothetical protein